MTPSLAENVPEHFKVTLSFAQMWCVDMWNKLSWTPHTYKRQPKQKPNNFTIANLKRYTFHVTQQRIQINVTDDFTNPQVRVHNNMNSLTNRLWINIDGCMNNSHFEAKLFSRQPSISADWTESYKSYRLIAMLEKTCLVPVNEWVSMKNTKQKTIAVYLYDGCCDSNTIE